MFLLGMLNSATPEQGSQESILFHPVLKAYPIYHSEDHHHPCFIRRFGKTMEDVYTTESKTTTTTRFPTTEITGSKLSTLSITGRITNVESIYTFCKPLICTATQPLKRGPSFLSMACHLSANAQREASYPS